MHAHPRSPSPRLHPDEQRPVAIDERSEEPDRVRAPADAGDERRDIESELTDLLVELRPMTDWNSRTMSGNGDGPRAEPSR